MPSAAEVRRASRRKAADWRTDWQLIRPNRLALGVAYCCLSGRNSQSDKIDIQDAMVHEGLSVSMASSIIKTGEQLARAPTLCVLADPRATTSDFNKKIRSVIKRLDGKAHIALWQGRNGCKPIHAWASAAALPITLFGQQGERLNESAISRLIQSVDHFVVFECREDKSFERVTAAIKAASKTLDVVFTSNVNQTSDLFE